MGKRTSFISLAVAASVIGALLGAGSSHASDIAACDDTRGSSLGASVAVSHGLGLPAVVGGRAVVDVAGERQRLVYTAPPFAGEGIIRHVSAQVGRGTAYVVDRRGADRVVIVTPARTIALEQPGEATHPSWSTDGRLVWSLGSSLRMWSAGAPAFDITPPAGALGVFSPVFVAPDAIVAVVAEPEPGFTRVEDEGVDNLFRYDLNDRAWVRLTRFHARGDRWVAIRTPLVRSDGSVEFVRLHGVSSRFGMPTFALWRLDPSGATSQLRGLPREMYLAGVLGGRRVWNVFDQTSGEWRLYSEASGSTLVDLGCGTVMVDPRSVNDPDRTPGVPSPVPSPTPTPIPIPTPTPSVTPASTPSPSPSDGYTAGILIGDFSTIDTATAAADAIKAAFGETTPVEVVDSATAPNIVRPGVWAAVMLLPSGSDSMAALLDLRSRLPEYRDWSWVVSV